MGLLDRLFGREQASTTGHGQGYGAPPRSAPRGGRGVSDDQRAVERYRYLLRTAPPEQIEQAHAEAFARLTPDQRRQVLEGLSSQVPGSERSSGDDPRALARMATRAEVRSPGTLERSLGRGGMGMGGLVAGSLLASVAGAFIGTSIAGAMFDDVEGDVASGEDAAGAGGEDVGGDYAGGGDAGGGDFGGGAGFGGDFGDVV